jgi:SAM-dependent methyltransferase
MSDEGRTGRTSRLTEGDGRTPLVADDELYKSDADLYDRIYYREDLYRQAADFILGQLAGVERPRVLDLCAGTGSHARVLGDAGANVVGVDRSAAMLALAAQKAPSATFIHADVRELALAEQFDAVLCLYGAIHYLETAADARLVLERAFELLAPSGVLVLELRDGRNASGTPTHEFANGLHITTFWKPARGVRGSDLYVVSAFEPMSGRHFAEVHNLFLTTPERFASWARRIGFSDARLLAWYSDVPCRPADGSDVAVLVARRPSAPTSG